MLPDNGLPLFDNGEFEKSPLFPPEPLNGVDDLGYFGGVAYWEPGVGGAELGGRPRSFRCAGVKGISETSSGFRKRGRQAMRMLKTNTHRRRW